MDDAVGDAFAARILPAAHEGNLRCIDFNHDEPLIWLSSRLYASFRLQIFGGKTTGRRTAQPTVGLAMRFAVVAGCGVKGLPLGSPKTDVRAFFAKQPDRFKRGNDSVPADFWPDEGVFAYYRKNDLLEAMEFSTPAAVFFEGKDLLSVSMAEAFRHLKDLDANLSVEEKGTSVISRRFGIALWCAVREDEHGSKAESVLVFGEGYYESEGPT